MNKERNCKYYIELIPLGVGHDLESSEQLELGKHIEKCADCKKEFDSYISAFRTMSVVRKNLENLEKQGLPSNIKSHVIAGIKEKLIRKKSRKVSANFRYAAAALIILSVSIAIFILANISPEPVIVHPTADENKPDAPFTPKTDVSEENVDIVRGNFSDEFIVEEPRTRYISTQRFGNYYQNMKNSDGIIAPKLLRSSNETRSISEQPITPMKVKPVDPETDDTTVFDF